MRKAGNEVHPFGPTSETLFIPLRVLCASARAPFAPLREAPRGSARNPLIHHASFAAGRTTQLLLELPETALESPDLCFRLSDLFPNRFVVPAEIFRRRQLT